MPKEQRIEEVERGSTPLQVDHVRSSAERNTGEMSSREKKSQDITNEGRVDNFEGPGEMQRKCLQERRKARTSPTKVEWTTLRALGRCRGSVFKREEKPGHHQRRSSGQL